MTVTREVRAAVAASQPARLFVFAAALLLPALLVVLADQLTTGASPIGIYYALAYGVGALALFAVVAFSARRAARATADKAIDTTLVFDGTSLVVARDSGGRPRKMARDRFRSGLVVPSATGHGARLSLQGDLGAGLEAWIRDRDDARALLRDLRLSGAHRPHAFHFFLGLRVTVGLDGIEVAWPFLERRRFVPYACIVEVRDDPSSVILLLDDGRRYEVVTGSRNGSTDAHRALLERIADARDAWASSERAESLALLARAGRPTRAWVTELRALSEASGSEYRSASLPTEALVRIAIDPKESEEMRIGAALALRGARDVGAERQIRDAAEASASPRVRVALEVATLDLDDDEVVERLRRRAKS